MKSNHKKGLLSAIVVTYNQPKYLYETIQSILSQDYPSIELIIADDGTPHFDKTTITDYIENNKRNNLVRYTILHDEINRGTVRNINRALENVHGEFVKLIGGDDCYIGNRVFSDEIAQLQSTESALGTVSKVQQCDAFMNPIHSERVEKSNKAIAMVLSMDYDASRRFIVKHDIFPIAIQATCFRWEFFELEGFCDERFLVIDDSPTVLKILKEHDRFVALEKYTVKHRSDVGISVSKELFSVRRIKYYKDCVTYSEIEIRPNPQIYGRFYTYMAPRVDTYVYKMTVVKKDRGSKLRMILLTLQYGFPLALYFLQNTSKVVYRIKRANRS